MALVETRSAVVNVADEDLRTIAARLRSRSGGAAEDLARHIEAAVKARAPVTLGSPEAKQAVVVATREWVCDGLLSVFDEEGVRELWRELRRDLGEAQVDE